MTSHQSRRLYFRLSARDRPVCSLLRGVVLCVANNSTSLSLHTRFSMHSQAFRALLALCAFATGDAFMTAPSSSASLLRMGASSPQPSSGLDGTRRDVLQTASAAIAGVLASTVLPAGALAEAKADPNRKGAASLRVWSRRGHVWMCSSSLFCRMRAAPAKLSGSQEST